MHRSNIVSRLFLGGIVISDQHSFSSGYRALLLRASGASTAKPESVRIQYYPDHNCTDASHYATLKVDTCYGPIFNFAQSFQADLPSGCYVYGWSTENCTGDSPDVEAFGPQNGLCYITGVFMGEIAQVQSFILHEA